MFSKVLSSIPFFRVFGIVVGLFLANYFGVIHF